MFIEPVMVQPAASPLLHSRAALRDQPDLSCEDLNQESNGVEGSLDGWRLEGVRQRPFDEGCVFPPAASARCDDHAPDIDPKVHGSSPFGSERRRESNPHELFFAYKL